MNGSIDDRYVRAQQRSIDIPVDADYEPVKYSRREARVERQRLIAATSAIIVIAGMAIGAVKMGISSIKNSSNENALRKFGLSVTAAVHDNVHRTSDNQGYYYSNEKIAKQILLECVTKNDYDLNSYLFGCYTWFNYDAAGQMDVVLGYLSDYLGNYMENNPDYPAYFENIANSTTFEQYLVNCGVAKYNSDDTIDLKESVKLYKARMMGLMNSYAEIDRVRQSAKQAEIDFQNSITTFCSPIEEYNVEFGGGSK